MIHISARITDIRRTEDGVAMQVTVDRPGRPLMAKRAGDEVEIGIEDGRLITPAQRRKIYATLNDIAQQTGNESGAYAAGRLYGIFLPVRLLCEHCQGVY